MSPLMARFGRALLGTVLCLIPLTACGHGGRPAVATPKTSNPASSYDPTTSAPPSGPAGPDGSPSATSAPSTRPAGSPTVTGSPSLADYLARLPTFPPAPVPEPVVLHHGPDQAAWAGHIPTTQRVAFLTIDDGVVTSPDQLALVKAAGIPVTLFLTTNTISHNKDFFASLQEAGAVIESHTVSHPLLTSLGYDAQRYQLCHATDLLEEWYGRRPLLFRPPYGEQNATTLRAAWDCGLQAGFLWRETVNNGVVRYQTSLHVIQPGDIILMHFRTTFAADFVAALQAIKAAGLVPALLEDYVTPPLTL